LEGEGTKGERREGKGRRGALACPPLHIISGYATGHTRQTRAFRERKPLPMPNFEPKVIRGSNPDFRINPYLDVTWIVRMIRAKIYEKLSKFVEVTAKILSVFFSDTV